MPRTFGVEVEYAGDRYSVTERLRRAVQVSDNYDYTEGWVSKTDGSVYNGGEVASRILDYDLPEDRNEVTRALLAMSEAGAVPSEQAGIHIHVGTHGLDVEALTGVAWGFTRLEDFYYRLASSGWDHMRENAMSYAFPFTREAKALMIASDFEPNAVYEATNRARYFGINFGGAWNVRGRSLGSGTSFDVNPNGTLEFRIFNSTMNPGRLQAFISAAVGLVKAAELGRLKRQRLTRFNCYPLGGMAEGWRSDAAVVNAAMRTLSYGGRVLSNSDRRNILRFWRSAAPQTNVFGAQYVLPGWTGPDTMRGGAGATPVLPISRDLEDQTRADTVGEDSVNCYGCDGYFSEDDTIYDDYNGYAYCRDCYDENNTDY